jgi:hypothetical protein
VFLPNPSATLTNIHRIYIDYLKNVITFKISTELLENVNETVSFDPREQNVQYRLYKQKQLFNSTTVSFYQTY